MAFESSMYLDIAHQQVTRNKAQQRQGCTKKKTWRTRDCVDVAFEIGNESGSKKSCFRHILRRQDLITSDAHSSIHFGNICWITMYLRRTVSQPTPGAACQISFVVVDARQKKFDFVVGPNEHLWTSLHRLRVNTRVSFSPRTIIVVVPVIYFKRIVQ